LAHAHPQRFFELTLNNQRTTGRVPLLRPVYIGRKLIQADPSTPLLLLISDQQTRIFLWNLLSENHLAPQLVSDQKDLLGELKKNQCATVLIDCWSVTVYGAGIISKIKVCCPPSRIIIFCDKSHLADSRHRELIKEILSIGVYACIMAPYKGWEVISLASYYPHLEKK